MARSDSHRPSVINPADYDFVAFEHLKCDGISDAQFLKVERERIRKHMACTGGDYSRHEHGGTCHICGSVNAIYTALFHHKPSNSYIRTGLECADKLDCGDVEKFRRQVRAALEANAGKRKAQAVLEKDGLTACWDIFAARSQENPLRHDQNEERIICDIVGKLVHYGNISEPQTNFLRKLLEKIAKRGEIMAAREAEHAAAKDFPVSKDRMTVIGQVVSIRPADYDNGIPAKMLVQHSDGWKVWGTIPQALETVAKGAKVKFDARVQVSDKDSKFGFFSRPTKPEIIPA